MFRYRRTTLIREIGMILLALLALLPFYLLVNVALKGNQEAISTPAIVPTSSLSLDGFSQAIAGGGLLTGLLNSVIITVGSLALLIGIGSVTAYVVVRRGGRLGGVGYFVTLIGIVLPFQLGLLPTYIALRNLGLIGTQIGMILLYTGLLMPVTVFLYANFARSLPREFEEAAEVDGARPLQTFRTVVFPLLAPATGTVAIMNGLSVWNDFFNSLIFLSGSNTPTLTLAVYTFAGNEVSQWNVVFSGLIIAILPMLVFYLVAQRAFIQGFAGGLKS